MNGELITHNEGEWTRNAMKDWVDFRLKERELFEWTAAMQQPAAWRDEV